MRRALIVGIDAYSSSPLSGCVADAVAVADALRTNADGAPNWLPETRLGDGSGCDITRDSLRDALARLFTNCRDHDLLFFFAGHGARTLWGADLVTQDASENSLGVSMNDLMTLANDCPARSATVILDCCFSGDAGSMPGVQPTGVSEAFRLSKTVLRENVSVLAASRSTEVSAEFDGHGAFTRVLLDGLEGGATDHLGKVTALSLYSYISNAFGAWEQRPLLKANLTEPVVLRVGPPWLEPALLRELPKHFPAENARVQMTPAHEGAGRPLAHSDGGTPEQQQFDYFGRLRNAGLVTTDGRRDHYWVAMESGHVYLTTLGRYFWRLANRRAL
jgi:hypothetical protein